MSPTETHLLTALKAPVVPLVDICDRWLNINPKTAREAAALNRLPFPTFKMSDSNKAPLLVSVHDLAEHIDARHTAAKASWAQSQV